MTFWQRTPRSVYQVYDEERYLAGEGVPDGVGEPAGTGRPVGDEREWMQELSHGPRVIRLLVLGLLGVVTAIAATIVAAQVLHHTKAAPVPIAARRDHTRSLWTASQPHLPASQPHLYASRVRPGSTRRTVTSAPVASAPRTPAAVPYSSIAALGRSGGSAMSPSRPSTRLSAGIAGAASWPTSESHVDDEFGFER